MCKSNFLEDINKLYVHQEFHPRHPIVSLTYWLLFCVSLSACHQTTLSPEHLPPEVFKLAASGTPLSVEISVVSDLEQGGTQFALLAFPFGSVSIPDPQLYLEQILYRELALAGFRPHFHANSAGPLHLQVELKSLRSTAYDLVFMRRIRASTELSFTLAGDSGAKIVSFDTFESESEYRKYGFEQDLRIVLNKAVRKALSPLLNTLSRFRKRELVL